jgi:hypothetical protein
MHHRAQNSTKLLRGSGRKGTALGITLLVLVVATCSIAPRARAQTAATGALTGIITDQKGAALPGATIQITNQATHEARELVSQQDGNYFVPQY